MVGEIARKGVRTDRNLAKQERIMKPKKPPIETQKQKELFRVELTRIIDKRHPLVKLSEVVDWEGLDQVFGKTYHPQTGRSGISTRLMVSLHYLKYAFGLSDGAVVAGWVENPYWQVLSGMKYFEHEMPIDPSSMVRWRKRIGESGAEELLKQTLESGLKVKAIKKDQFKRANVDTSVQEKAIRYPTDARLSHEAREKLVKEAKALGIKLRQTYTRKSKEMLFKQGRYRHARQMKRANRCVRKLRTYLGRVLREMQRKVPDPSEELQELFHLSQRIYQQKRTDKHKLYSLHAPEVACISKGKAHKPYEFGCKVSIAATSKGGWVIGAKAFHGNPYDGHTLQEAMDQVERISPKRIDHVFVDKGYRGHNYKGDAEVHVDKTHRGRTPKSLWKWMKRRAAIEPTIGHLKEEHLLRKNRLKGEAGDKFNVILSAAGMNFMKLLKHIEATFLCLFRFQFFSFLCSFQPCSIPYSQGIRV